jgi:hypothetical protein
MRALFFVLIIMFGGVGVSDAVIAQGTKDPSNPVPTMIFPVRPRDEPARPTAVPNNSKSFPAQPVVRVRRAYRVRVLR